MWWKIGCLPCGRADPHHPLFPLPEQLFYVAALGRLVVKQIEVAYALVNAALYSGQLQLCKPLHSGPLPSSVATIVAPTTSEQPGPSAC